MRALEARHGARMTAPAGPKAGAPGGSRLRPAPPVSRPARAGTWPIVARAPRGIPALRPCAGARQVSRIPPRSLPSGLSPARVCARLGAHSLSRSPPHTARRQSRDTAPACTAGARCLPESQGHRSTGTLSPPRGGGRGVPNSPRFPFRCATGPTLRRRASRVPNGKVAGSGTAPFDLPDLAGCSHSPGSARRDGDGARRDAPRPRSRAPGHRGQRLTARDCALSWRRTRFAPQRG